MDNAAANIDAVPQINEVFYICGGSLVFYSVFPPFTKLHYPYLLAHTAACGQQNGIKPQDPIRCRSCGYRILYKTRTKRCKTNFPYNSVSCL